MKNDLILGAIVGVCTAWFADTIKDACADYLEKRNVTKWLKDPKNLRLFIKEQQRMMLACAKNDKALYQRLSELDLGDKPKPENEKIRKALADDEKFAMMRRIWAAVVENQRYVDLDEEETEENSKGTNKKTTTTTA